MQQQWDVLVIGAGPAGLSAAAAAAESGLEVILLDEQQAPGGQIYRAVTGLRAEKNFLQEEDRKEGLKLVARFKSGGAVYSPGTTVWFAEPGRVIAGRNGSSKEYKAQVLIVAAGAMERPVPFRGWTLPGVMTAGAADILHKSAGLIPEGPVVLAGNGPLIPLVANHLLAQGVPIAAILDTSPAANKYNAAFRIPGALRDFPLLWKGAMMMKNLLGGNVPIIRNVYRLEAMGKDKLERVACKTAGGDKVIEARMLLFHEGVIPRTHISRLLKIDHAWNGLQRYWYPVCDRNGETNIRNVLVAGDGAFVHGAEASALKGELAGINAARLLRVLSREEADGRGAAAASRLKAVLSARPFVDAFFAPNRKMFQVDDDVMVCRCEGVSAGEIRKATEEGCFNLNDIKIRTRCGMGPCQGRMCGPAMAEIAAAALSEEPETLGALNVRPPIRPMPFREVCEFEHEE